MFRSKLALAFLVSASSAQAEVDFAHEVVPLLQEKCVECHGGEESKGGFSMNTRALSLEADVIDLKKPDRSILIELILSDDLDERMPPPKKQKHPLSDDEVDIFRRWIAGGLPWEEGFTFAVDRYKTPLKPRAVKLPDGPADANPIDLLVEAYFDKSGSVPPKPIADEVFLRRLWLDVVGLPPGEEAREMLSAKRGLDRDAAIEKVLADSTGYADHWMSFWNDLLRNEYTGTGYIDGGRQQVTAWLYKSLLENKPYDEFVSDLMTKDAARGFIGGIKWRGNVNASQKREIQFSQNVSQVLLGINMKCASCHDSFIDEWTLKDAYSLAAIYSAKPLEMYRCDIPTGEKATPGWIFPELGEIDPEAPRDKRLEQLAGLMTHPENGRMQRTMVNRLWDRLMGRGVVHPVDAMNTEPWSEDVLDYLANHLVAADYDLKAVIRLIVGSKTYQARTVVGSEGSAPFVFEGPVRKRMTAEQFIDAIRSVIGIWPKPDGAAFKGGAKGGQLKAVMNAHGLKKWDDRPVRTVFAPRDALQASLGRPNREQVVTSRPDVLTTLEAINLANGPELSKLLQEGAKKLAAEEDPAALIDRVFLDALTREPTTAEREVATSLLGSPASSEGIQDLLWMVFMLPEFHYVN